MRDAAEAVLVPVAESTPPRPHPVSKYPSLLLLVALLWANTACAGLIRARIFVGLPVGDTQSARQQEIANSIQTSLCLRGAESAATLVYSHEASRPLRREAILTALAPAADAAPDDETWIVLLGTSAPGRDGRPAFQISGPRLSADDFAAAVAKLPGKKFIVVATSASGGFLPPLLNLPEVEAVAATADQGEVGEPRFAAYWADALAARPRDSFAALAASAAAQVSDYYTAESLAESEHPRMIDRAARRIVEGPFTDLAAAVAVAATPPPRDTAEKPAAPVDVAALSFPKSSGAEEIERRPADDESRALLAAARAAAKDSPHAALILRTEVDLLVSRDFSSRETWRSRAYLRTGEALDSLGTLRLNPDSPTTTATLVSARVIRPDGGQLLLDPAARRGRLAAESNEKRANPAPRSNSPYVELPEVTADCVVEAEWTIDRRADGELPEFYREWNFAEPYPRRSLRVRLTLPREERWRAGAPNLPASAAADLPAPSSAPLAPGSPLPAPSSRTLVWELADLPAREALPGDPPPRSTTPWIGVSSVASWDTFAAWYRRLAAGSETTGPGVEALADEIAAARSDRAGRLRAAYERVAALRYVPIELGVGAFRPRTPEQVWQQRHGDCKDKANLLVAVLARLGIPAEFVLVNRFDTTFTELPGWQFNHAIARVPAAPAAGQPRDLWLDTTDRLVPFGVVAPGNLGRQALVFAKGFSAAAFHRISPAQEPSAEWRETFAYDAASSAWRIQISATGSAEVALRHLLLDHTPARRRERLRSLLDWPEAAVAEVTAPDPYDLNAPFVLAFAVRAPADAFTRRPPAPLAPGLAAHLAPGDRPRLWDEGRPWRFVRTGPGVDDTRTVPARLP